MKPGMCFFIAAGASALGKIIYDTARKRQMTKLGTVLYCDSTAFLNELTRFKSKFFINEFTRKSWSVDAYLKTGDYGKINELYDQLDQMNIKPVERIKHEQRKLVFYLKSKQYGKIEKTLAEIKRTDRRPSQERKTAYDECALLVEVYARKSMKATRILKEQLTSDINEISRGVCYCRLAYLYYYNNRPYELKDALRQARYYLKNSVFANHIDNLHGNIKNIEDSVI